MSNSFQVAVIGLGYVGLPLALELAKKMQVIGFDISKDKVQQLNQGIDPSGTFQEDEITQSSIQITHDVVLLKQCNFYIVAVPTPVNSSRTPDLSALISSSKIVGHAISKGNIVVYESTVYPGATEEQCIPVLEETSGLKFGDDFTVGYSPERINPGDQNHTLNNIVKVVSGSDAETLEKVASVYEKIIDAGLFKASSIQVAEAAKVIENTQRDLNIALMNELAVIFEKLHIPTQEVLQAASTKWNFLKFSPGLVGGHCIGVDPYYLTHKALEVGYQPEVILAGRRINDSIGKFIAEKTIKLLLKAQLMPKKSQILVLGFTFKENINDVRNTKVIDIVKELNDWDCQVDIFDPIANRQDAYKEYGIDLLPELPAQKSYNAVIISVAHDYFSNNIQIIQSCIDKGRPSVVIDVKSVFSAQDFSHSLYWSL